MADNALHIAGENRSSGMRHNYIHTLLAESRRMIDRAIDECEGERKESPNLMGHRCLQPAKEDLATLVRGIRSEALFAISTPLQLGPSNRSERQLIAELIEAGKRVYLLYSRNYAEERYVTDMFEGGGDRLLIRTVDADFCNMIVIDRQSAVVWADVSEARHNGSVITNPEMMHVIYLFTRNMWMSAAETSSNTEFRLDEIDDNTIAVVRALSSGLKDEAAARNLSVSLRTYRRYVADLMFRLGAISRFQFGARAAELGLLEWVADV
jgi:DNA-binding NarL/FixJ family response regulator